MDKIEKKEYHQAYYAWKNDNSNNKGIGIVASSFLEKDIKNACNNAVMNKYSDFEDRAIITEYFQYNDSLGKYINYGIYDLESVPFRIENRPKRFVHIYLPTEYAEHEEPSDYIRKMNYFPRVKKVHNVELELTKKTVEPYEFHYEELLKKYHLDGTNYQSRLSILLSMEFTGFFNQYNKQIAFILEDDIGDEEFHKTAIEMTWLLHQWIPDCFETSIDELRHHMGYAVAKTIGNDPSSIAFFFIPRTVEVVFKYNENRFDLTTSYTEDSFEYKNKIEKGADFFYELAEKAQTSQESIQEFLRRICENAPRKKPENLDELLEIYQDYQFWQRLKDGQLDWEKNEISSLLEKVRYGECVAQKKCISYFQLLLAEGEQKQAFLALTPECIAFAVKNLIYLENIAKDDIQIILIKLIERCFFAWQQSEDKEQRNKDEKAYEECLDILKNKDSIWSDIYDKCVCPHLRKITDADVETALISLHQCLRFYGEVFGKKQEFCAKIDKETKKLYLKLLDGHTELCKEIEKEIKEHEDIFNKSTRNLLTIPVCSQKFYDDNCYITPEENSIWYGRAEVYLKNLLSDSNFQELGVEQYADFYKKLLCGANTDQAYYREFERALNDIAKCGKEFLETRPDDLQQAEDIKKIFYWLAAERKTNKKLQNKNIKFDKLFTVKTFTQLLESTITDKEINKIKNELKNCDCMVANTYSIKENFYNKSIYMLSCKKDAIQKMSFDEFAFLSNEMSKVVVEKDDKEYSRYYLTFLSFFVEKDKLPVEKWKKIYNHLQECGVYQHLASIWESDTNMGYTLKDVVDSLKKTAIQETNKHLGNNNISTNCKNAAKISETQMQSNILHNINIDKLLEYTLDDINTKEKFEQYKEIVYTKYKNIIDIVTYWTSVQTSSTMKPEEHENSDKKMSNLISGPNYKQ